MQLCLLPSNKISRNIFVTKEHKLHWMSSDIVVYILRNKLCEQFRDQFLSPYSLDSYLQLKQMEDRPLNGFTYVAVEHLWKHYPKSQTALSQQSQSRPFTCLKCKGWGFFCFNCYCHQDIKIYFLFILLVVIVPEVWATWKTTRE